MGMRQLASCLKMITSPNEEGKTHARELSAVSHERSCPVSQEHRPSKDSRQRSATTLNPSSLLLLKGGLILSTGAQTFRRIPSIVRTPGPALPILSVPVRSVPQYLHRP